MLTLKKSIQQENPNTLFLMAGDTISPSVESITYKGAQMIEAWNTVGLDYATFGNHEFDFGPDVLKAANQRVEVWLDRGKRHRQNNQQALRRCSTVRRARVWRREGRNLWPGPAGNKDHFEARATTSSFAIPVTPLKRWSLELHAQGVKVVVALTHLSMREDKEVARCADVDLIIGGHEHTLLESHAGIGADLQDDCRRSRTRPHRSQHLTNTASSKASIGK